jgi:hypothetical protein
MFNYIAGLAVGISLSVIVAAVNYQPIQLVAVNKQYVAAVVAHYNNESQCQAKIAELLSPGPQQLRFMCLNIK